MFHNILFWMRHKLAKQFNFLLKIKHVNGAVFCNIYNFIRILAGDDGRISFSKKTGLYRTESGDFHIHFCEKGRSRFYKQGPEKRVDDLTKNYFIDTIKFESGDVVIDCGANIGEVFFYFKKNEINIEYMGFEPSPREFECLKLNAEDKSAYNIGLWHEESSLDFYISSQGADSSIIKPKSYSHVKKIKTSRLDDVFKSAKRIKLLKLEAEGAEPEVLLGCGALLDNIEYVAADLGFERGIKEESTFLPVVNFLLKNDFKIIEFNNKKMTALFQKNPVVVEHNPT